MTSRDKLGIDNQSTLNTYDDENSHVDISSDELVSSKPEEDRFRKRKFESTSNPNSLTRPISDDAIMKGIVFDIEVTRRAFDHFKKVIETHKC